MRADMAKVIVERPRRRGIDTRLGRKITEHDLMPSTEGMRAPHVRYYGGKELNENLAPLLRFLESRVGKPWDDVYSEICENIRVTNAVQDHIRVHVKQFVETSTSMDKEGRIWINGYRPFLLDDDQHTRFYVDPCSGLLCRNPNRVSWSQRQREYRAANEAHRQATARSLPNGVELRKHDGVWYEVTLSPVPAPEMVDSVIMRGYVRKVPRAVPVYDVLLKQYVSQTHGTYVTNKRQLNHHELKKYGVSND